MMHFAWPLMFFCLPLPWVIDRLAKRQSQPAVAVKVPFFAEIKALSRRSEMPRGRKAGMMRLLWGLLVCAAARPQIPDGMQEYAVPARDIVLALDISRSMTLPDAGGESRLDAVKSVAADFVGQRKNDRIGIVLFAEQANLYMPLTLDGDGLRDMLGGVRAGWLGSLTAVGDAVGLALRYLENSGAKHKIVILLTDGASNAGNIAPADAVAAARGRGVTLYTIGFGSPDDPDGGADADFLQQAAERTGGLFFMARDGAELARAYETISRNEPMSDAPVYLIRQKELYPWPLSAFALIVSAAVFARVRQRWKFRKGAE